jgi:hypothetical protein
MIKWFAVYRNGRKIFEGYKGACERLVKNMEDSVKLYIGPFSIEPIEYQGVSFD